MHTYIWFSVGWKLLMTELTLMGLHILFLSFNSLLRMKCLIVSCLVVLCQTVRNKDLFNDSPLLQLIADNPYDVLNSVPNVQPVYTCCLSHPIKRNMAVTFSITPGPQAVPHSTEI